MEGPALVCEGQSVVIELQGDERYVTIPQIKVGVWIKAWKKSRFQASELIGQPYGALFEVRESKLVRLDEPPNVTELLRLAKKHGEDNRNLRMTGDAQGLTQEQIEEMKKGGKHAHEIIAALMENSATLETKTQFAQEKWLKKKMAKYVSFFRVVKPSGMALAKAFWAKDPQKVEHMRWDALAWMLSAADLRHGTRPLIVDGVWGILTGAVAERMYGQCDLITSVFQTPSEPKHVLSFFNFPASVSSKLKFVAYDSFVVEPNSCHSLLIAVGYKPDSLLKRLWSCLVPGNAFAIFSQYPNAFDNIMMWLRKEQLAVEVRLTEIFFRQYQVLEGRTHPDMQMNNASGFVLTGIKVVPQVDATNPEQVTASARKQEKKKKGGKGNRDSNPSSNKKQKKEENDEQQAGEAAAEKEAE